MSRHAVIVDAIRSPMAKGKPSRDGSVGGALSDVHPVELLGQVIAELVRRNDIDPIRVDDVIAGCVSQVGEQTGPVGRWAWLAAGMPESVPSVTVHRACGSSQQAADFAAQGVIAGVYDIVIAAGVESMSRVPMFTARMGQDPFGPGVNDRYQPGLVSQGISAELVAARWKLDREALDEFSARSHSLAHGADFTPEIVPITTPHGRVVSADETIRPATTVEQLSALKPSFESADMGQRFPEIADWRITAGNSSQLADGAAAMLIMDEATAVALGLRPRARFHAFGLASDDPITMLSAPIPATTKALQRAALTIDQIDHYEINEAFAPVPLAWAQHFAADTAKLNPRGGAIALGHPLGASGTRLMTTMLNALENSGGRFGLQSMCEAGGMANATIIERL
ncbi:acetyl-CoA acetyltransferase [Mycolicibacterium mucogenicum]|uniref:Acetyl-CoA acetyltransferase n=1 Tax=Mycolicibacterium mucogenicum TaxID=56689 RepID=A0A1A3HDU5_MYCMU|nr:thiolase family protein [Mycolicibacterium mucogenicum]OBJ46442.1 acetyl-CoA acetyltransferase [Mycolicibacterium mucogenicum]